MALMAIAQHHGRPGVPQLEQSEGDFRRFASAIHQVACDVRLMWLAERPHDLKLMR
jgi:hypothetical protein